MHKLWETFGAPLVGSSWSVLYRSFFNKKNQYDSVKALEIFFLFCMIIIDDCNNIACYCTVDIRQRRHSYDSLVELFLSLFISLHLINF